jgi:hypothetical protein
VYACLPDGGLAVDGAWLYPVEVEGRWGCDTELRVVLMGATCSFQVDFVGEVNWRQGSNAGLCSWAARWMDWARGRWWAGGVVTKGPGRLNVGLCKTVGGMSSLEELGVMCSTSSGTIA